MRRWLSRACAVGISLLLVAATAPAAADATTINCQDVSVQVELDDGSSGPIVGRLCVPPGAGTVQVLVHGLGYDQYYFDLPHQPEKYSVARAANQRGQASLTLSRLGVGDSYRPLSAKVTLQNNAAAVHQVVEALRDGSLNTAFDNVVLVGHSYGSLTSWLAAGRYGGVDAIVATGASHQGNWTNVATRIIAQSPPAVLDPKFRGQQLDPGYVATRPGGRTVFYNEDNTDPAVIAVDETLKQTATLSEVVTYLPDYLLNASRKINIPVLAVNATDDPFFCNGVLTADCSTSSAFLASERHFYGPGADVDAMMVPDGGHNVTLARDADRTIANIQDWIGQHTS